MQKCDLNLLRVSGFGRVSGLGFRVGASSAKDKPAPAAMPQRPPAVYGIELYLFLFTGLVGVSD